MSITAKDYKIGAIANPGAGFLPLVIGLGLAITGIFEIVKHINSGNVNDEENENLNLNSILKVVLAIVLMVSWPMFLSTLGYLIVTFLVTLFFAKLFGMERLFMAIILALGTTLAVHYLFRVCFYLDLPDGLLQEYIRSMVTLGAAVLWLV